MTIGATIGAVLPLAVGIAIFPIPILTVILLLLSRRSRANGMSFAASWILGIGLLMTIFTLLAEGAGAASDRDARAIVSWIRLALGLTLLYLAVRQWRARLSLGQEPETPRWMQKIDDFTPGRAFRTGLLLSAGNPKNMALAAAAGTTVAQVGLSPVQTIVVVSAFTALASVTIAGPVIYRHLGDNRATEQMEALKDWLVQNSSTIMAVILVILGAMLVGNGISALSS